MLLVDDWFSNKVPEKVDCIGTQGCITTGVLRSSLVQSVLSKKWNTQKTYSPWWWCWKWCIVEKWLPRWRLILWLCKRGWNQSFCYWYGRLCYWQEHRSGWHLTIGWCYNCCFSFHFLTAWCFLPTLVTSLSLPQTSISTDWFSCTDYVTSLTHKLLLYSFPFYDDASFGLGQVSLGPCTLLFSYINYCTPSSFSWTLTYSIPPQIYQGHWIPCLGFLLVFIVLLNWRSFETLEIPVSILTLEPLKDNPSSKHSSIESMLVPTQAKHNRWSFCKKCWRHWMLQCGALWVLRRTWVMEV